jgi:hypothetical protein
MANLEHYAILQRGVEELSSSGYGPPWTSPVGNGAEPSLNDNSNWSLKLSAPMTDRDNRGDLEKCSGGIAPKASRRR